MRVNYFALFKKYVRFAQVMPDSTFSDVERGYILDKMQRTQRLIASQRWTPGQKTCTRRIKAFLSFYSEFEFSLPEIAEATGDKVNTCISALQRLTKHGIITKTRHNRWRITRDRFARSSQAAAP